MIDTLECATKSQGASCIFHYTNSFVVDSLESKSRTCIYTLVQTCNNLGVVIGREKIEGLYVHLMVWTLKYVDVLTVELCLLSGKLKRLHNQ